MTKLQIAFLMASVISSPIAVGLGENGYRTAAIAVATLGAAFGLVGMFLALPYLKDQTNE